MLGASVILTRLLGKFLASANAMFLIVTSTVQFTGLYDTCWCDASILSLGRSKGWVILFATDAQIATASSLAWIGGTALSIVLMALVTAFLMWSRGDEIWKMGMD